MAMVFDKKDCYNQNLGCRQSKLDPQIFEVWVLLYMLVGDKGKF